MRIPEFKSDGPIYEQLKPYIHPKDGVQDYMVADNYYGLYHKIAKKLHPWSILEIGVRFGYSAVAMLLACGSCDYAGIDNESYEPDSNKYARSQIEKLCSGMVELIKVDTQKLEKLELWLDKYDLIHVDGAHRAEELFHDLDLVLPFCHQNTYVLVDDTEHEAHRELKVACRQWSERNKFEYRELDSFRGMTVMVKSI